MADPLGNPPEGTLAIFISKQAAEEFIQGDPFVHKEWSASGVWWNGTKFGIANAPLMAQKRNYPTDYLSR
jgi:hypothetical protein